MLELCRNIYNSADPSTHYEIMIKNPKYNRTLILFADNRKHHKTSQIGGNTAVIRPFNRYSKLKIPKSAGISTGSGAMAGGYEEVTAEVTHFS